MTELERRGIASVLVATAQHREMLDDVLRVLPMKVDHDLDVMQEGQSPADVVSRISARLAPILEKEHPDMLLVQGDTTSTFASALTAFHVGIPVGHVEAGLRTWDLKRPYPEEGNRRMVTQIADLHFAPTERAMANLLAEHVPLDKIFVTGNTAVDSLLSTAAHIRSDSMLQRAFHEKYSWLDDSGRMLLVTVHRRESFGVPIERIFSAFLEIIEQHSDVFVLYPVHPNPNVRAAADKILRGNERIVLVEPLDYGAFIYHMMRSYLILTDSGGIQEEAPSLDKPVLVLRDVTERPEAVEAGCAKLAGTQTQSIVGQTDRLLSDEDFYQTMASCKNPFGDGHAARRIVDTILEKFGDK